MAAATRAVAATRSARSADAPASRWLRQPGWWLLLAGVLIAHAVATLWLSEQLVGWGDGGRPGLQRIEVAFVQALAPAVAPLLPAVPAPAPRPRPRPRKAAAPAPAASAAREPSEPPPSPLAAPAESAVEAAAARAHEASASAAAAVAPAADTAGSAALASAEPASAAPTPAMAASAAAPAFEWPPSTRLSYSLHGNYRGELHGSASVQWIRQGERYQVHLDVAIGPSFAPLITRRMTSDGELGEQGLVPRRYDESTRLPFQQPRRSTLRFTPEHVTLANGSQEEALPGVQDSASQFVQLTWLFTTRPDLLRTGNTVTMPLALPRRVGRWVYDVLEQERLSTPVGAVDAFHLKPRLGERRPGNELSAEAWFAPSLQYLPVRIRIQQDAETFVDLMLDAAPMQAAAASAPR